jgi:hypothetical protein
MKVVGSRALYAGGNVPNASPASGIGPNFQVENLDNKQGVRFSGLPADGEGSRRAILM